MVSMAKVFLAAAVAVVLCAYIMPADGAGLCYYTATAIASYRQYVRTYYYYYRYYYRSCGWWGWRRCRYSYRVYVYYTYSYVSYTIDYHSRSYCCWGYSGSQCTPICYNSCGHCSGCSSPYHCSCYPGWTGSTCCSDYNECYYNNGGCEQNCHNTVGSYYCSCYSGYSQSGSHCVDINECSYSNGGCNQKCHNTHGSFYCSCESGYYLSGGNTCYDINECNTNNGNCDQNCINQPGTYHCTCNTGYTLSSNLRSCIDNNECTNGVSNCNHFCLNTPGSYLCYCQLGYELDIDHETCINTIECNNNNGGCVQHCHDTVGSYYCTCDPGYTLNSNGHGCDDINECDENTHLCDHNCYNNIGSYTCDCQIGYYLDANGLTCHDINECDTNNGGCEHNCTNVIGSYNCSCAVGWLLDEDLHGCSDHDECATNVHDCDENGDCHNTHGTYYCTCHTGFRLDADQRTCNDINECAEHISGCTQVCNNDFGSYHCTCYVGFQLDADIHNCSDINECNLNTDGCERYCHNLIGSYYCSCQVGYQLGPDLHACVGQPCSPQLPAPANGQISCTGDQVTDQNCTFSCSPGYQLMGSKQRNCLLTNSWTGLPAYCQILQCEELEAPVNGYIWTQPCRNEFQQQCEIRCVDGFYINDTTPYYQTCNVNVATNQVYWSEAPVCEYIPPCLSSPCQHGGSCSEVSPTKYYCNCAGTYYTGLDCDVGYVDIPGLPIISAGTLYSLVISARPENHIILTVSSSSPAMAVSDTTLIFNSTDQSHTITVSSTVTGTYTLSYSLSGADAAKYETPKSSLVIFYNSNISPNPPDPFTAGCCSPGGQIYQCPYSSNTVTFKSTCTWEVEEAGTHETQGIVFASGNGISLPFSIAGIELTISGYDVSYILPDDDGTCGNCGGSDPSCYHYTPTPEDIVDMLAKNTIAKTYLNEASNLLPTWITFSVGNIDTQNRTFSLEDYTSFITTGSNAYLIPGCSSLDLNPDGLYSVFSYRATIAGTISGAAKTYTPGSNSGPICFAINLCEGTESSVHISIPSGTQQIIKSLSQFQTYINNNWQFDFHESQLRRTGVPAPDDIPADYWVEGTTVNTNTVIPDFDLRLELDASKNFYNQQNVGAKFLFSGNLYHNSQPTGAEVQGMLTGDITLLLNMTLNEMLANMTLVTTSSPALFTMPDHTLSSSLIKNGIALKLNILSQPNDKFFKKVLPLPTGSGSCPFDAYVRLTSDNNIDYIQLYTMCTGLSLIGFNFPAGSVRTRLFLSGNSKPSTPNPSYNSATFVAYTDFIDGQIQLNDFITATQPSTGHAASIGYSAGSSVSGSIAETQISVLGTHFTIPLGFDSTGFSFQVSSPLYGQFDADLTGSIPYGKTWDDFSLTLNGQFDDSTGGFVRSLETYVYGYTQDSIADAQARVANAEAAVNKTLDAIAAFNPIISSLHNSLNNINDEYTNAQSTLEMANYTYLSSLNAAAGLSNAAYEIYADLLAVCQDQEWSKQCAPTSFCWDVMSTLLIDEHGIGPVIEHEQMLRHKIITSLKERWTIDYICRVLIKIKGWARIGFGHMCSYTYVYEESSYDYRQSYHTAVNVSHTRQTIVGTHEYTISKSNCRTDTCGSKIYSIDYLYQSAGCRIARKPVLNSLNSTERELIMPLITLMEAKQNLTIAANDFSVKTHIRKMAQQDVNDATAIYQSLQNQNTLAQTAYTSVLEYESNIITLGQHLANINIQNLFSINSISFQTTVTDTSPEVLPISILYTLTGLNTYTVTANAQFTASLPVLQRELAKVILDDVGGILQQLSNKKKRSIVQPSFNEHQFEQRCAMLNSVKDYLQQIYTSLGDVEATVSETKMNLTSTIDALTDLINYTPSDYPNINFTFLAAQYNTILTPNQLTTLASTEPEITALIQALMSMKTYTMNLYQTIGPLSATNWQLSMENAHQNKKISSVAGQSCYSFADCLNVAVVIVTEVLKDTPGTSVQAMLQNIPAAKSQLLSLALNTNLNISMAIASQPMLYQTIEQIMAMNYWCTSRPTITQPLTPSVPVQVGATISITCQADSVLPITYSWKKDGFVLPSQTSKTLTKVATIQDEGQYQCLATNVVGTTESTFADVIVYIAPKMTRHPSDYETYEGDDNGGYFVCNATGHPIPSYMWYFRPDTQSEWTLVANDTNELVVRKPTKANQGWYHCHVTASIGEATSNSAYLSILRTNISKLVYTVTFNMNITNTIPVVYGSGVNMSETMTPPESTTTIDYFRNEIKLGKTDVDHLQVGFSIDGNALLVHITLSAYYEYQHDVTWEVQSPWALAYETDLLNAVADLEKKVQQESFWFKTDDNYYQAIHHSANVADLQYWCPEGTTLQYSNFLCVSCPPGTYFESINGTAQCTSCPMNTYLEEDGGFSCMNCPAMAETLGTGSRWRDDCISYCRPGFNSSNGLEPCQPCPPCTYNNDHKQTTCTVCTESDINNADDSSVVCYANCSETTAPTTFPVKIIASSSAVAVAVVCIAIILLILIVVMIIRGKQKRKHKPNVSNQPRTSIAVPNDILSLVPESEQATSEAAKYNVKENDEEDDDKYDQRDVVNPLFLETQQESPYEDLEKHQHPQVTEVYDEVPKEPTKHEEPGYATVGDKVEQEDLKGIGGLAARKAALFGR